MPARSLPAPGSVMAMARIFGSRGQGKRGRGGEGKGQKMAGGERSRTLMNRKIAGSCAVLKTQRQRADSGGDSGGRIRAKCNGGSGVGNLLSVCAAGGATYLFASAHGREVLGLLLLGAEVNLEGTNQKTGGGEVGRESR